VSDAYAPVWRDALPYLRVRKNDVHVPISVAFAQRLLDGDDGADRDVVLLAVLLHDVGWAVVDQEAIFTEGFGPGMMESAVRIAHEREGARIAREVLGRHGYAPAVVDAVAAIIDGHDTRREAISHDDELMKDADKLWRFTPTGVGIACDWFGLTPAAYADDLVERVAGQLFTEPARTIAAEELGRTRELLLLDVLRDS
jgi:hypothetical protein